MRILTMVRIEIGQNAAQSKEFRDSLKTKPAHGMMNLTELTVHGWIIVASNYGLLKLPSDVARALGPSYQMARQINELLRIRQEFSTTMISLANYQGILALLDKGIIDNLEKYITQCETLGPSLEELIGDTSV